MGGAEGSHPFPQPWRKKEIERALASRRCSVEILVGTSVIVQADSCREMLAHALDLMVVPSGFVLVSFSSRVDMGTVSPFS